MKILLFVLLAFVSAMRSHDFKTRCEDLTAGVAKSFYFRSRCYVLDNTATVYDNIVCDHLKPHGHLALLPGTLLVAKIYDKFNGHMVGYPWIGLKRNQTVSASSPVNSKDFYYWTTPTEQFYAPAVATYWKPSEPDQAGCGLLYTPYRNLGDDNCISARGYVCQYRDHKMKFKGVLRGVRGSPIVTVDEETLKNPTKDCAQKCKHNAICHSFTASKATGLCALHMLPIEDLITETLTDGVVFEISD